MNDFRSGRNRDNVGVGNQTRKFARLERTDQNLVEAVECLGKKAAADGVELEVVDIPDDVNWAIGDVCGIEYVRAAGELWPKGAVDKNV